jgi:hypothetical protein
MRLREFLKAQLFEELGFSVLFGKSWAFQIQK